MNSPEFRSGSDELLTRMNEYQLMVEEVLGGMDMMLSRLESRVVALEEKSGITSGACGTSNADINQVRAEMQKLRLDTQRGFDFVLRKIG